jgi:ubiquitin-activating enzyme E1
LGFEIAKNIILTGPKSVSIYDPTLVEMPDLGANFYFNDKMVGKVTRADVTASQLKDLHPHVRVEAVKGPIDNDFLKRQTVVIVTELLFPMPRLLEMNKFCRAQTPAVGFIMTLALGLYGFTFVDFGPKLVVKDVTGENPSSYVVTLITKGTPGIVHIHDAKKHEFNDDEYVKFREVEGMAELNASDPVKIKVINRYCFSICDTSKFGDYTRQGSRN